jgi:hypothetical protein
MVWSFGLRHPSGTPFERLRSTIGLCRAEVRFPACNQSAASAKVKCLTFFLFFSAQCIVASLAQENSVSNASPTPTPISVGSVQPGLNTNGTLSPVIVIGRENSLIGIAGSASEGTVGHEEISERPVLRPGEIMETIPGMIVTQHAGGGKANQYFLRGFNLDPNIGLCQRPVLRAVR